LKGILFLQGSAAPHRAAITHQKLLDHHCEVWKHPANSSDLTPSDSRPFPNSKQHLRGKKFLSIEETTLAVDEWFAVAPTIFLFYGLKKLEQEVKSVLSIKPKTYEPSSY
jgi:hypothetical protein